MADYVLIDGDQALFEPNFGPAAVVVQPGALAAKGSATVGGKPTCIDGDEASVEVAGCSYVTPQYSISGQGTLRISALAPDQRATKTRVDDTPAMLVGSKFVAEFQVTTPAMQPPPGPGSPIPDSTPQYMGKGCFQSSNKKFRGV